MVTYTSLGIQLVKFITEQQVEIIHCFRDIIKTEKQELFRNTTAFLKKTNEGHWRDSYLKTMIMTAGCKSQSVHHLGERKAQLVKLNLEYSHY